MVDTTYIGNFTGGLKTDRLPFNINNDTFPTMVNFYSWRGRAKRKRGTVTLGRAEVQLFSSNATAAITGASQSNPCVITASNTFSVGETVTIAGVGGMTELNGNTFIVIAANPASFTINIDSSAFTPYTVGGTATINTGSNSWVYPSSALIAGSIDLISSYGLPADSSITPNSINLTIGVNTYTEPATPDGTLIGAPAGTGTINYATGVITISGGTTEAVTGNFDYYPAQPILGLENFSTSIATSAYPYLLTFDQEKAYFYNDASAFFYNISYYKGTNIPFSWSGLDYQQFWSTNYQSAFWATNNVPGFHFLSATFGSGSPGTAITLNFQSGGANFQGLLIGDQVWFNEFSSSTVNGLTGTVTDNSDAVNGNYVVTFTASVTVTGTGIVQMLTNGLPGQDGIRWLDGDPTGSIGTGSGLPNNISYGWVNFAPPLTENSVSIDNSPLDTWYLVGSLLVLPFKDRLLFFSPYIQSSTRAVGGQPPIQLQDVVIWSQNGTPYYATPTPTNETVITEAFYVDEPGYGGYLAAGISQPIVTVTNNEDVLLVSFSQRQTRFVYTGNDLNPFLFFTINSELGTSSTYSGVTLDRGGVTIGQYGITITTQQSSQRIDLDIPDFVFQIDASNNGSLRVNGVRDYFKEWIYFCYPVNQIPKAAYATNFPTQTFLWNYRDNTWAILYENFTSHGTYRAKRGYSWSTCPFTSWNVWNEPWNSGTNTSQFPSVAAGNPQGYVLLKGQGTGEGESGAIESIAADAMNNLTITSVNHCLTAANPLTGDGDFIYIQGCLGTTSINNVVAKVIDVQDVDTFTVDLEFPAGTYLGLGTFARLSQPLLQTKQFNFYWERGRQAILGTQKYLLDRTANGQATVNIYLSQDDTDVFNGLNNNAVIYSQILYTCPESINIGLTPANTNLQMPTAASQYQIWHRFNTSLIGDTFQIGITLSEEQMKNYQYATSDIALHAIVLTSQPGPQLA